MGLRNILEMFQTKIGYFLNISPFFVHFGAERTGPPGRSGRHPCRRRKRPLNVVTGLLVRPASGRLDQNRWDRG